MARCSDILPGAFLGASPQTPPVLASLVFELHSVRPSSEARTGVWGEPPGKRTWPVLAALLSPQALHRFGDEFSPRRKLPTLVNRHLKQGNTFPMAASDESPDLHANECLLRPRILPPRSDESQRPPAPSPRVVHFTEHSASVSPSESCSKAGRPSRRWPWPLADTGHADYETTRVYRSAEEALHDEILETGKTGLDLSYRPTYTQSSVQ